MSNFFEECVGGKGVGAGLTQVYIAQTHRQTYISIINIMTWPDHGARPSGIQYKICFNFIVFQFFFLFGPVSTQQYNMQYFAENKVMTYTKCLPN